MTESMSVQHIYHTLGSIDFAKLKTLIMKNKYYPNKFSHRYKCLDGTFLKQMLFLVVYWGSLIQSLVIDRMFHLTKQYQMDQVYMLATKRCCLNEGLLRFLSHYFYEFFVNLELIDVEKMLPFD